MAVQQTNVSPIQRIQVTVEPARRAKICLESYDDNLGWYTAASLSIPLHQLPLLEQALERIRRETPPQSTSGKIIPFPG